MFKVTFFKSFNTLQKINAHLKFGNGFSSLLIFVRYKQLPFSMYSSVSRFFNQYVFLSLSTKVQKVILKNCSAKSCLSRELSCCNYADVPLSRWHKKSGRPGIRCGKVFIYCVTTGCLYCTNEHPAMKTAPETLTTTTTPPSADEIKKRLRFIKELFFFFFLNKRALLLAKVEWCSIFRKDLSRTVTL